MLPLITHKVLYFDKYCKHCFPLQFNYTILTEISYNFLRYAKGNCYFNALSLMKRPYINACFFFFKVWLSIAILAKITDMTLYAVIGLTTENSTALIELIFVNPQT